MANLTQLALELSQISGRERPWTGKYLHSLIKGYDGFRISDSLKKAIDVLSVHLDKLDEPGKSILVDDLPPGIIVTRPPRQCATLCCERWFLPGSWNQKYCTGRCRQISKNTRRRKTG